MLATPIIDEVDFFTAVVDLLIVSSSVRGDYGCVSGRNHWNLWIFRGLWGLPVTFIHIRGDRGGIYDGHWRGYNRGRHGRWWVRNKSGVDSGGICRSGVETGKRYGRSPVWVECIVANYNGGICDQSGVSRGVNNRIDSRLVGVGEVRIESDSWVVLGCYGRGILCDGIVPSRKILLSPFGIER